MTNGFQKIPKAHVSEGFTPLAPQKPQFNTSRDLKLKNNQISFKEPSPVLRIDFDLPNQPLSRSNSNSVPDNSESEFIYLNEDSAPPRKQKSFLRRFAVFIIFLVLFAGSLNVTYNYLLGRGFGISNPLARQQAVATTNANLRSEPSTKTDDNIIGLVTKDSRLSVIRSSGSWYEVEIIQQGRQAENAVESGRGWIHASTIKISE